MRVVIWGDMEGITCITKWDHVNAGAPLYEEGRQLYTGDINAAVRGAKRAGASEIVVVDGHGAGGNFSFNSLLKERLEPGAEYVFGHRWGCYVEPFEAGFDALLLVGAHAMAGVGDGVLCHTISSASWFNAFVNGEKIGESALAAYIAGSFGVPMVFVSGDEATAREARALVGDSLVTAPVKKGITRTCARCLPPSDAQALIENRVAEALGGSRQHPAPAKPSLPVELKVELTSPDKMADFMGKCGCEMVDARTIASRGDSFWKVWDQFWHH
jgi:D-amino peptidase